jgi:hypothetical protein
LSRHFHQLKRVAIQTLLGDQLVGCLFGTQTENEGAEMIGCKVHS